MEEVQTQQVPDFEEEEEDESDEGTGSEGQGESGDERMENQEEEGINDNVIKIQREQRKDSGEKNISFEDPKVKAF